MAIRNKISLLLFIQLLLFHFFSSLLLLRSHIMHINYGEIYLLSCTLAHFTSGMCLKNIFLFIRKICASHESRLQYFPQIFMETTSIYIYISSSRELFFFSRLLLNSLKNFSLYCCSRNFFQLVLPLFSFLSITFLLRVINKLSCVLEYHHNFSSLTLARAWNIFLLFFL